MRGEDIDAVNIAFSFRFDSVKVLVLFAIGAIICHGEYVNLRTIIVI